MSLNARATIRAGGSGIVLSLVLPVFTVFDLWPAVEPKGQKLTADQLVQRHVESLGSGEALARRQSFVMMGTCKHEILLGGRANMDGKAQLVSRGNGVNFLIDFARADYNGEQFITDGKKATTAFSVPGTRFPLSDFLFAQKAILREGLFGGALTMAWPLLKVEEKKPILKLKGSKKIDGRELHQLDYRIRKRGGDARIRMFFSPEDFSHVLTTYEVKISAQLGASPEQSAGQRVSRFKLEERFSDFRDFGGLQLPATWVVQIATQGTGSTSLWQWTMKFDQSSDSQEVPDSFFVVN